VTTFVHQHPESLFVPTGDVFAIARETGSIACDIPGAELSDAGELCHVDAFLATQGLGDPALKVMEAIVCGADAS
jgi:hypothetical protein